MRLALTALVPVLLLVAGCSDGDDDRSAAQGLTTTTRGATTASTCDEEPAPPDAADGTPAEIVATAGGVRFAVVDRGASVDVVSLYHAVGCALAPLTLDGAVAALSVGGSVTHGDGIRCDGDEITVLSATSDDGATYQATSTTYRVVDGELVLVRDDAETIDAQADPGTLDAYYRLDC